jgi:chloride channel 3/4/5
LPYLDSKNEYIHQAVPAAVLDAEVPTIILDEENTVGFLKDKITELETLSFAHGLPILAREPDGRGLGQNYRMEGYISVRDLSIGLAAVKDAEDSMPCAFRTPSAAAQGNAPTGVIDLGYLTDMAPITVSVRSPMELLHELFVKLGVRYLVVVDERGLYCGVIDKNRLGDEFLPSVWMQCRIDMLVC